MNEPIEVGDPPWVSIRQLYVYHSLLTVFKMKNAENQTTCKKNEEMTMPRRQDKPQDAASKFMKPKNLKNKKVICV